MGSAYTTRMYGRCLYHPGYEGVPIYHLGYEGVPIYHLGMEGAYTPPGYGGCLYTTWVMSVMHIYHLGYERYAHIPPWVCTGYPTLGMYRYPTLGIPHPPGYTLRIHHPRYRTRSRLRVP